VDETNEEAGIVCERVDTPTDVRHIVSFARAAARIALRFFP